MVRRVSILSFVGFLAVCSTVAAQTPGVLYTWNGTGTDTYDWFATGPTQTASLSNTTPGQLTVTELGYYDAFNDVQYHGGSLLISDGFNRLRDSATFQGGLDVSGLSYLELDVSHNGAGTIDVQFYTQVGPGSTFTWANLPDYHLVGGTNYTLQFPLSALTPEQRAYVRTIGLQPRAHTSIGDVTWTISEVRSVGTPLTVRDIATHDVGSSDNGFNGVVGNFDLAAIVGNDGGQNQSGLSINNAGSGSLRWTDKGGDGTAGHESGAAVTWANGTGWGGIYNNNTFFERPADVSNYNRVLYRMKATDVNPGGGGTIGVQAFFQNGAYNYRVAGVVPLPVDGQYHDFLLPLGAVSERQYVQAFGVNLGTHPNDVTIDVDLVEFQYLQTTPGDYNFNNTVDAADYAFWRKLNGGSNPFQLDNEVPNTTPGTVTVEDRDAWQSRFGNSAPGSGLGGSGSVPEPAAMVLIVSALVGGVLTRRRVHS
jgi:hypothetical protein